MVDSSLDQKFAKAVKVVQSSEGDSKISNSDKLLMYSLFKQATIGECNIKQPSMMKVVERAKYSAWKAHGKMTKDEAKQKFVDEFNKRQPQAKL